MKLSNISFVMALAIALHVGAQNEPTKTNVELFSPLNIDNVPTPYRSQSGEPSHDYWQNEANYKIEVALDEAAFKVAGQVEINYINHSPDLLDYVWLQLDQNKFTVDSDGTAITGAVGGRFVGNLAGGYKMSSVKVNGNKAKYLVTDTRMQIQLDEPVKAKGGELMITIDYDFNIPEYGADRMGRMKQSQGWVYEIAQWFPRMAVYDDVSGWNNQPYLGSGEFYLDYGTIDYKITVPYDQIVVGSGELMNIDEVFPKNIAQRYREAQKSDKTFMIIDASEVGNTKLTRPVQSGNLTWHYKIKETRDAAWASSKAFILDGARINLPNGNKAMALSAYTKESATDDSWNKSTEYVKYSIENNSKWFDYTYPVATNVAGIIGGMEYPGIVFCYWKSKDGGLWGVTDHEFGHNWFPMVVGSNERLYPWMDEGFNTFINHFSTLDYGVYPSRLNDPRDYVKDLTADTREAINTPPDVAQTYNLGMIAYRKPALGLLMLREVVLGQERFDFAFKNYIKKWAFKHPRPIDFFNAMENAAGDDLDWFWKSWFYGTGNIDQAVIKVNYYKGRPENGALVTLENIGEVPMPVMLQLTDVNGEKHNFKIPVQVWMRGNSFVYKADTNTRIVSALIDPEGIYPDIELGNNRLEVASDSSIDSKK